MDKESAKKLLEQKVQSINLRKHCYAVSFAMGGIYEYLLDKNMLKSTEPSKEEWEVFGLIHDADYELTKEDPYKHTIVLMDWLRELGMDINSYIYRGIQTHNAKRTGYEHPSSQMEWALECCDELTGFIVACALILPSKSLNEVSIETVKKRMKEKAFARAVDRSQIEQCDEKLGIPLDDFVEVTLNSMKSHSAELGL